VRRGLQLLAACLVAASLVPVGAAPALAAGGALFPGATGSEVLTLQRMLTAQKFYRGPLDGRFGTKLEAAVVAFHKEIGAARTASWRSGDWDLLVRYQSPWLPSRSGEPDRLEINITAQVLYLIQDERLAAVIPISSGNGELFYNSFGDLVPAHTPRGDFELEWHVQGMRISYLGQLWRPWYFVGGYALHGSPSVPPDPASHGCIRVPMWESDWLEGELFLGMPMHVWDAPQGTGPVFGDQPNPETFQLPFVDDEGIVHEGDIGSLAAAGITHGCDDFFYCPEAPVTRGQMAAFLVRAFHLPRGPDAFSDDGASIFEDDINSLAAAGITRGCEEDNYCPDRAITREQMAAFLVRVLGLPSPADDFFADDDGSPFEADINALASAGITTGCSEGDFCPKEPVTRGQMASFLVRALGGA
jgi:hypothetical protein